MQVNREKLKERIKECRKKAGLTQEELADRLHVKRQIISYYESLDSERTPNIDILAAMADLFNTTTDYLLGRTDAKNPVDTYDNKIIRSMCDYTGLSEESIEELYQANSCLMTVEMDYLSDFIKSDIFGLIECISGYDASLRATTRELKKNIDILQEAIDNKTNNYIASISLNKFLDKDYRLFLIDKKIKEILHHILIESEKECIEAEKEKDRLFRIYMKEVVNNANDNETE